MPTTSSYAGVMLRTVGMVWLWWVTATVQAAPFHAHVINGALLPAGGAQPLGLLQNADVTVVDFPSPTRMTFDRTGRVFDVHADVDLVDAHTFVELRVDRDVLLQDTGAWTVVMQRDAHVALVGGSSDDVEVAFPETDRAPVTGGRVQRGENTGVVPDAKGAEEPCAVLRMHAAMNAESPSWEPTRFMWTVHRRGAPVGAWRAAWAQSNHVVVHGFVLDDDVACHQDRHGGLGFHGTGAGASDGLLQAREATLPAHTALYAATDDTRPLVKLHKPTRALQKEDGSWRIPALADGRASVVLHTVYIRPDVKVSLGPLKAHGVGSVSIEMGMWPRKSSTP